MKRTNQSLSSWQGTALALIAAASLAACGGGGSTVNAVPQSISSLSLSAAEVAGGTANLSAQASSGLTSFTYTSSTPSICTVSNAVLTFLAAGTCTVSVTQAGNANFSAASTSFNFAVSAAAPAQPSQQSITFSSGFATATTTVEGGGFTGYSGSNLDGWYCAPNPANCSGGSGGYGTPATSSAYYYFQSSTVPTGEYVGITVFAPGVTALSATGDTNGVAPAASYKLNFKFNQNAEWYNSATKNFVVLLALGKKYTVNGSACYIQLMQVVAPTSVNPTSYSLPLSSFVVAQDCGTGITTVANALAASPNVAQIDFQGDGGASAKTANGLTSGANFSVLAGSVYPTTVALTGGITFTP
jgi:hypothetical protein